MSKKVIQRETEAGVLEMCRKCYSFRQEDSWHFERAEYFLENDVEEKIVRFIQCPACVEEAEGEVLRMHDLEYA